MRSSSAAVALALLLPLAGCAKDDTTNSTLQRAKVVANDTTCGLTQTTFTAGDVELEVANTGKDVTEVYVYGKDSGGAFATVVGEVENIAPGTSRDLHVSLDGGEYEVACKPGQKGDGIRTEITVTGKAGTSEAAYDRELEVTTTDFAFAGMSGFTAKAGEKIEFKLHNNGQAPHNLVIVDAAGKEVGEVHDVAPGKEGEAIIELATAGTYTFSCTVDGHADKGMKGTFTVS